MDYCPEEHKFLLHHQVETSSSLHKPGTQTRGETVGDDQGTVPTEPSPEGQQLIMDWKLTLFNEICACRACGGSGKQRGEKQEGGEEGELEAEGGGQRQGVVVVVVVMERERLQGIEGMKQD